MKKHPGNTVHIHNVMKTPLVAETTINKSSSKIFIRSKRLMNMSHAWYIVRSATNQQ